MRHISIATIEGELVNMSDSERQSVIEIATGMIDRELNRPRLSLDEKRKQLKASAKLATEYYQSDNELTI